MTFFMTETDACCCTCDKLIAMLAAAISIVHILSAHIPIAGIPCCPGAGNPHAGHLRTAAVSQKRVP